MDLLNKKIMIIGLGKSGIGAANLCLKHGALVTVADGKPKEAVGDALSKIHGNVKTILGRNPGHDEVLEQDLIVPSPAVPLDVEFLSFAKENGIPVWSEIELASRFSKAEFIGITGTNGKTTTTTLVGEIASKIWPGSKAAGNIGLAFTEVAEDFPEGSYAALELSSFQLESIDGFRPHISAILNFTPDHLNRHHTYENYVAAKCRVFEYQTDKDFVVLNYDDPLVREKGEELLKKENHPAVVYFSRTVKVPGGIYLLGRNIVLDAAFPAVVVKASEAAETAAGAPDQAGHVPVADVDAMQIFGPHNEENAMAAAAILLLAGAPLETVRKGLYAFKGVAHRIEYVGTVDGVSYYNDSKATNPDAAIKGILAMKSEKTVLIGGGYDK
nr:UDP-N-acetylmuramoyl-L-alanine--D-glutamate ligase [Clostridia bacterium]